mmetsp:Transcript_20568/g.68950  ORF Transcript_20568/g.68950 Transcript_20568/m.68950 type:complete len:105 (+) Transcript_20568:650-964(+)
MQVLDLDHNPLKGIPEGTYFLGMTKLPGYDRLLEVLTLTTTMQASLGASQASFSRRASIGQKQFCLKFSAILADRHVLSRLISFIHCFEEISLCLISLFFPIFS